MNFLDTPLSYTRDQRTSHEEAHHRDPRAHGELHGARDAMTARAPPGHPRAKGHEHPSSECERGAKPITIGTEACDPHIRKVRCLELAPGSRRNERARDRAKDEHQ